MTPRFDTNLIFATVDQLLRSTQPTPQDTLGYTKHSPLKMPVSKAWLVSALQANVQAFTSNLRVAVKSNAIPQADIEQAKHEIARRKAYIKRLRAKSVPDTLYMALYETPELEEVEVEEEEGPSWN